MPLALRMQLPKRSSEAASSRLCRKFTITVHLTAAALPLPTATVITTTLTLRLITAVMVATLLQSASTALPHRMQGSNNNSRRVAAAGDASAKRNASVSKRKTLNRYVCNGHTHDLPCVLPILILCRCGEYQNKITHFQDDCYTHC